LTFTVTVVPEDSFTVNVLLAASTTVTDLEAVGAIRPPPAGKASPPRGGPSPPLKPSLLGTPDPENDPVAAFAPVLALELGDETAMPMPAPPAATTTASAATVRTTFRRDLKPGELPMPSTGIASGISSVVGPSSISLECSSI
jgi:hypothetical protein